VSSPTSRTLSLLKKGGYTVAIVERWNQYSRTRHDLYGFADILAMKGTELLAVQATSGSNVSARITKILAEPRALEWVRPGSQRFLSVIGWSKKGARGKRKTWTPTFRPVVADDWRTG
jgi:hypothetical protein